MSNLAEIDCEGSIEFERTIRIGKATTIDFGEIWVIDGMYNPTWASDVTEWRVCPIGPIEMNGFKKMSIEKWLTKLWALRGIQRELDIRESVRAKLNGIIGH